jgi:hypothetical protein
MACVNLQVSIEAGSDAGQDSDSSDDDASPVNRWYEKVGGLIWLVSYNICGVMHLLSYDGDKNCRHTLRSLIFGLGLTIFLVFNANTVAVLWSHRSKILHEIQEEVGYTNPLSTCSGCFFFYAIQAVGVGTSVIIAVACTYAVASGEVLQMQPAFLIPVGMPGMLSFAVRVWRPYDVSCRSVRLLIKRMETSCKVDWDELARDLNSLDIRLGKLWSPMEAGAPLLASVTSGVAIALSCAIFRIQHDATSLELSLLFFFACMCAAVPLALVSGVTTLCMEMEASAESIPAVASRYPVLVHDGMQNWERMPETDKNTYRLFMLLMHSQSRKMGLKLCGFLISRARVAEWFIKLALIVPTIYEFLSARLPH